MTLSTPPKGSLDRIQQEARDEAERQQRVAYQMVSMHSEMRDKYSRRHTMLLSITMFLAVLASGFAFGNNNGTIRFGDILVPVNAVLGGTTMLILFLTVLDLITDWSGKAKEHAVAATALANLRSRQRELSDITQVTLDDYRDLTRAYNQVVDTIVAIPQRHYQSLYARHQRMVATTKTIREYPGLSVLGARRRVRQAAHTTMRNESSAQLPDATSSKATDTESG